MDHLTAIDAAFCDEELKATLADACERWDARATGCDTDRVFETFDEPAHVAIERGQNEIRDGRCVPCSL